MPNSVQQVAPPEPTLLSQWLPLSILSAAHVVGSMAFIAVATMAPLIREDLALSATQFGFLVSVYFFTQAFLALPIGAAIDKIGIRLALAIANTTILAGTILLSGANSQLTAMIAMSVLGIGYCFVNPSTSKAVFLMFPPRRRGTAMGIKQSGVPIGGVAGAAIGGLAGTYDWRLLIALVGILAIIIAVAGLIMPLTTTAPLAKPSQRPSLMSSIHIVLADRNLTTFNFSVGLYQAAQFSFFSYITLFMREAMLASQPLAAACLAIGQVSSAAGRMSWGAISDILFSGRRKPVLLIMTATATSGLLLMSLMSPAWGTTAAVVLTAVLGLSVAGYVALIQTIVVETADPHFTATSIAYNRLFVSLGASIGPPLFGAAIDMSGSYQAAWLVAAGLVFCALLLFGFFFTERRSASAED